MSDFDREESHGFDLLGVYLFRRPEEHTKEFDEAERTIHDTYKNSQLLTLAIDFRWRTALVVEIRYEFELLVGDEVIDGNGHANNVAYVMWMQEGTPKRIPPELMCFIDQVES